MTATNGNCTPEEKGYLSFNPRKIPQISVFFQFQSCCCEDSSGVLLELLYQFALQKKLANPNILHVAKKFSPNGACNALHIDAILAHNPVGTRADLDSIAEYYVQLLGF